MNPLQLMKRVRQTYLLAVSLSFAVVYNIPKFFEQESFYLNLNSTVDNITVEDGEWFTQ